MNRLRSCEGCARHVFVTERVCPFCLTELAEVAVRALPAMPSGASRAQRLALAAALGGQGLVGCAQEVAVPVYGAPAPLAGNAAPPSGTTPPGQPGPTHPPAAGRGGSGVPDGGGVAVPVYGAPLAGQAAPPITPAQPDAAAALDEDAGVDEPPDASLPRDAGPMVHPVYGAPIPEYGAPPPPRSSKD